MSFIGQYREQMRERPKRGSALGVVLFGIAVVAAGVLGFFVAQTFL